MSAREKGRLALKKCISSIQWEQNKRQSKNIISMINSHPIKQHKLAINLRENSLSLEQLLLTHSEFKFTFSQPFTDLLLKLMLASTILYEKTGKIEAVTVARFLLQLNLLDELGYKPGSQNGDYTGDPKHAHFLQLCTTMSSLNISENDYVPSYAAVTIRDLLERSVDIDFSVGTALLFASESLFPLFANTFARNLETALGHELTSGFHSIHTDDEIGSNIEESHAQDCYIVLIASLTNANLSLVNYYVKFFLDMTVTFCDNLLKIK